MESGFGQNLEGFLIKGNLSLLQADIPALQGDGSIEGSGTLYINTIREYDVLNGLSIQDVLLQNQQIIVPYTQPSLGPTAASFVIDGGISIKTTTNSTSITCGGGLTIAGGAAIAKNVNVGGILDVNNNRITSVLWPTLGTDAANKDYVDSKTFGNVGGSFTAGQVIIGDTGGSVIGYPSLTFDGNLLTVGTPILITNTTNAINTTTASIVTLGGAIFGQDVIIGGDVDMTGNVITNVATPINPTDVATKAYVDSKTFGSLFGNFGEYEVVTGTSDGSTLTSYPSFLFDGSQLTLRTSANFYIENTSVATGLGSGGSLTTLGGASFGQNVYIGNGLDVNMKRITNVDTPVNPADAANKEYVDSKTYGNLFGNFGEYQLVTGTSDGNTLTSYPNLLFNGTQLTLKTSANLYIENTSVALGLGSGGSLTTLGGASFGQNVYIGEGLDVNMKRITRVDDPIDDYDAVNKLYVDRLFDSTFNDENSVILNNDVTVPTDITGFRIAATTKAFWAYAYVHHDNDECAIFCVKGYQGTGEWFVSTTFVGEPTNIALSIRYDISGDGVMQYTNLNSLGISSIRYRIILEVEDTISPTNLTQVNYTLSNNVSVPIDIPTLTFDNTELDAVRLLVHIINGVDECALVSIDCLLKDSGWVVMTTSVGNINDIHFSINNGISYGVIQYTNTNTSGQYDVRVQQVKVLKLQTDITLTANTFAPVNVDDLFVFERAMTTFHLLLYVEIPTQNKYAFYEIDGLVCDGRWNINSRYIGDFLDIRFYMATATFGFLQYTNNNNVDAKIKYILNTPTVFAPLPVTKGGTGMNYIEPYAVLRGNGVDPVSTTTDFIYKDYTLQLGEQSAILINNTTVATSLSSGGTFTTLGGASFGKNVIVGGTVNVSNNNIINVAEPVQSSDVATKAYVDSKSISGNFTTGQLIVAASNGTAIQGYDNIKYDSSNGTDGNLVLSSHTTLVFNNTANASGLGTGGAMVVAGGASIAKDVYIGGKLDVSMNNVKRVADPIDDYDAVNKAYLEATLDNRFNDENFLTLVNNTTIPVDISDFVVSPDVRAFLAYVYVQYDQQECAIFTLRGINRGTSWYLQKTFVGEPTNIDFFIRYDSGSGIVQYTNSNVYGISSIRYITLTEIGDSPSDSQINIDINNNVLSFQSIPELTFNNSQYDAAKVIMYVSNDSASKYGMMFLNCVLKGTQWVMSPTSFGNVTGINFALLSSPSSGVVQYTNNNNVGQYTLRVSIVPILKSQTPLVLAANTTTFTDINPTLLSFDNSQSIFQMTAFVTVPDMNMHALYELEGVHCDGVWSLNSRYIGDITYLRFAIETFNSGNQNYGTLRFINPNPSIAYIRYVLDAPMMFDSLPVKRGGSGNTYLTPNAVLRGNGVDPILASNDFVYKDLQLKLGKDSSVLLTNTSDASFISYGGANIGGNVSIDKGLNVKGVNMTPSVGDLFQEQSFGATHDIVAADITGFDLSGPNVKSFNGTVCITVKTNSTELDAVYDVKALKKSSGWVIQSNYFGDNLGIVLDITAGGQIQYSAPYVNNWMETKVKFRGLVTTV